MAVSLKEVDGQLVAKKVHLIPGKTRHRHVPGEVISVSDTEITIQPRGEGTEPLTFELTPDTATRFHRDVTVLTVGAFVVVGTARDPLTGDLLSKALEINVTSGKPSGPAEAGDGDEAAGEAGGTADVRDIFEGVDLEGNWIVDGAKVAVDPDTEISSGVAAGDFVKIDAQLGPGGTLLARRIEGERRAIDVSNRAKVEGVFEGVDSQGNWIIGGAKVAIGPSTDTDGLPFPGQWVKVKGHLRADDSLLAREIENRGGSRGRGEDSRQVKLEGIFQGTDDQGNWIVNGTRVAVDALTRLEGTPGVGRRVAVKAVLQRGGSLLAQELEGDEGDQGDQGDEGDEGDSRERRAEAKLRGVIQEVLDDGTLVVNGIRVALDALTELEGSAAAGDFVEVEGLLREDGSLLAEEVTSEGETETEDRPERSKVEIEGKIEKVNPDGSLVVNGIEVVTSVLSEIRGELVEGSPVKVKGVLRQDGSLLARQLRGEGRRATASGTEAKLEGLVERLNLDEAGNIVSFVIDGLTVATGALTKIEGRLEPEARVEVKAIISDAGFLAGKVEVSKRVKGLETSEAKLQGIIEALRLDAQGRVVGIKINGVEVALAALAKLEGPVAVGETVEIKGKILDGIFEASKVERERPKGREPRLPELKLEGLVEAVERDADGNVSSVVVNGRKIGVEALTRVKGSLELGATVKIEAVVKDEGLIAREIKATPEQRNGPNGQSNANQDRSNGSSKSERERKPARTESEED